MESPNRRYLAEVDQLRGFAAILVFFYHSMHSARTALGGEGWPVAHDPFSALLWEGHTGVALFFVLSGYILAFGTLGRQIDYWQFMRNRALRILPLLLLIVMFSVYGSTGIDFGQIAASILLLKNTSASFSDPAQLAGAVWTVAAEFQLYFIAPFLISVGFRRGFLRFFMPMLLIFWSLRLILLSGVPNDAGELFRISYFTGAGRANQFLIGIGLAYCSYRFTPLSRRAAWGLLLAGTAAVFCFVWGLNSEGGGKAWKISHIVLPEVEALIWALFLAGFIAVRPFGNSFLALSLAKLGVLSFGIYLIHYSVQRQFWFWFYPEYMKELIDSSLNALAANLFILGIVICLAICTWKCIEQPFLALRKRYIPDNAPVEPSSYR